MIQEIYIIDDDEASIHIFRELFKEDKEFKFIEVKTEEIDRALKNIPFLIIILGLPKNSFFNVFDFVARKESIISVHSNKIIGTTE